MKIIKDKKIIALILSIVIVVIIIINSTYSLLTKTNETEVQNYTTGILEITSDKVGDSITLSNALPMDDSKGLTIEPYTFKIENTGNLTYTFDVKLLSTVADNLIDPQYINLSIDGENIISLDSLTDGLLFDDVTLEPKKSLEVSLRVWLNKSTPNTQMGKVFNAKITTDGYAVYTEESMEGYDYLLILIENRNTDTPDFTKTSCSSGCEEATVGLYEYQDDLGTSYYFRGDVENNYVKFGKNASNQDMYWRIICINGDGTVRMIYDGTQAWENGVSSEDRQVGTSKFNSEQYGNAYVGYMYGQTGVTSTGTDVYNLTHSNDNNSTIKTYLEGELTSNNIGWYYENIVATGYNQYVADAIYCNDRSLGVSGTGIGTSETYYGVYERLYRSRTTDVEPQLTCTNSNDRFTISASTLAPTDGQGTNKKLKYSVGLITADEVVLAGSAIDGSNSEYYLYKGEWYWTMTPSFFISEDSAYVFLVDWSGVTVSSGYVYFVGGVRPVISLRSDALKYGDGTIGNEFRVE